MSVRIVKWPGKEGAKDPVKAFITRKAFDDKAEKVAGKVLADIKDNGNRAVAKYAEKFDGVSLKTSQMKVSKAEIDAARDKVDTDFKNAARETYKRIAAFAKAGMKKNWSMSSPRGGMLGEQFVPLDRVGVYIPGGVAPLASSALMTASLAKVAGVQEIVACTPCDKKGKVDKFLLHALDFAGATEIYKIGGIQAIGLMAYGTNTVPKVQKIVGPGGAYVTAAKRQVYGHVALDLVAGPSEIAILADDTAEPSYVAADLLSQIEHGTGVEKAFLVTQSKKLAESVREELMEQAKELSRKDYILKVISKNVLIVVVNTLDVGMDLCNKFAPEHFEIMVREPLNWLKKVRNAGAVFVGAWSPEAAGDFVAGPSHVLPTGGAASMFSGLSVDDFLRRTSVISFTRADLKDALPVIEAFGRVEGLDAHTRSAQIRFESK